tara:strand:+ start:144 stop:764 length:621 start_codon:yes stop_codon:yes gene_type:complete
MAAKTGTRERLIDAAQQALIDGAGEMEMQAVAQRAKASVGLAYHHFGSRAGLIAAVVDRFYRRLDAAAFTNAALPGGSWAARERQRVAAYVDFHYAHPLAPLVIGALSRSPDLQVVETAFTERQLVAGGRMIAAAQRDGIIGSAIDPEVIIALMIGGIRQALIAALARHPRPAADQLTSEIWTFMTAALRLSERAQAPLPPEQAAD